MIALGLVYSLHIAIFIFFEILTFRRLLFELMVSSTALQLDKSPWPLQILLVRRLGKGSGQVHQKHKPCQLQTTPPMVADIRLNTPTLLLHCTALTVL